MIEDLAAILSIIASLLVIIERVSRFPRNKDQLQLALKREPQPVLSLNHQRVPLMLFYHFWLCL